MKKKLLIVLLLIVSIIGITGCEKKEEKKDINESAIKFKTEYESLNGTTTSSGKEYRNISIPEDNPFVYIDAKEVINKIENGETFYLYIGAKQCPWCRSVIEQMISSAKDNKVSKIYYLEAWDNDKNEVLRDKYKLDKDGKTIKEKDGTEEYFKLLDYFKDLLDDYTYAANRNGGDKLDVKEKRIYLPSLIYIKNGNAESLTSGVSDLQTSSYDNLTEEMLKDETSLFDTIFGLSNTCDDAC